MASIQARMKDPKRTLLNAELNPTDLIFNRRYLQEHLYSVEYLSQLARYGLHVGRIESL